MALKGTIKDFGVADIFQLISQQAKTGVLVLSNDVDEVRVYFQDGAVVRAANTMRSPHMLLGAMMLRAQVLTQAELDRALAEQQRTLKRLGMVLVELGFIAPEVVTEFASLQMTETIYALFEWKVGTYEFETVEVEPSPEGVQPIRAETIVMNGIRMTDEWSGIRERIPSYGWLVERMRELPPEPQGRVEEDDDLDFSDLTGESAGAGFDDIGRYERRVYGLIGPERTVQKLIDLSRLGEFETCRAISTLMGAGFVRVIKPSDPRIGEEEALPKRRIDGRRLAAQLGRLVISAATVLVGAAVLTRAPGHVLGQSIGGEARLRSSTVESHLATTQIRVLTRALEVYRLNTGRYPERLEELAESGLVRARDLRFPFARTYVYRLRDGAPVILPPLR